MDDTSGTDGAGTERRRGRLPLIIASVAAAGLLFGIGATLIAGRFGPGGACAASAATAEALEPLAVGPLAAFEPIASPVGLGNLAFEDRDGEAVRLADYAGRTVLFNLWATWCAPCIAELPSLDGLQERLGGPAFEVVAVSIDTTADAPVAEFLERTGADDLALFREPTMSLFNTLKEAGLAMGMPTTLLVDGKGCAVGVLHGATEWDSPEAVRLVEAAMGVQEQAGAALR